MGRFLTLSALVLLSVPSTLATLAVDYAPITGVSQDGSCGNGVTCVGSSYGNCCSTDGTCGSTDDHCGDGCQPLYGICPASTLNKRYMNEGAELEKRVLEVRVVEARATSSLACRSASTAAITCVPSKTSVIRAAGTPTIFCKSWNAHKPHATSPFVAEGIALPKGVSNACDCILADTSYSSSKTSSSTTKTSSSTTKSSSSTTKSSSSSSKSASLTISLANKAVTSASITCVPSKTLVVRAAGTPTSFCKSWISHKPHSTSPFVSQGILQPVGVDNACSCILADTTYIQTVKPTVSSSTTTTTATTTAAPICVTSKTSIVRAAGTATQFCSSWIANKPHSTSPFTSQGIALPAGVDNACSCILADTGYVSVSTATSTTPAKTSATTTTTSTTSTTTSKTSTTTSKTSTTTSKTSTTTSKTSTTTSKTSTTTTTSKTSSTTSSSASSSACTLKKRRRRRDLHHPTSPVKEIPTVAW